MVGITRIQIVDDKPRDWRFKLSEAMAPIANMAYRVMLASAGMTLLPGETIIQVKKDELGGRYDHQEGIDIILRFADSRTGEPVKATMQEKILFTSYSTATFEERKNSRKLGAWYTCTAQYYAVLYTVENRYALIKKLQKPEFTATIRNGVIYNLPRIHQNSLTRKIKWEGNNNIQDGRTNPFRFFSFENSPPLSVVATYGQFRDEVPKSAILETPLEAPRQMTLFPEERQQSLFDAQDGSDKEAKAAS